MVSDNDTKLTSAFWKSMGDIMEIKMPEWLKKLRFDWSFVFRALYHERALDEEMGNRKNVT